MPTSANTAPTTPPPGDLSPLELRVFVAYLLAWPYWRIAMDAGISESTVASIVQRPRFKAAVAAAQQTAIDKAADIASRLIAAAPKALDRVIYLMENSKHDSVQMRTAFDILDRAGHKPTEHHEHNVRSVSFNLHALDTADKDQLRKIAEKAARANVLGPTRATPEMDKEIEL